MLKMTWKDYGYAQPFDMVLAGYVVDEPVQVRLVGDTEFRTITVQDVTPNWARILIEGEASPVTIRKDDVSWASRL